MWMEPTYKLNITKCTKKLIVFQASILKLTLRKVNCDFQARKIACEWTDNKTIEKSQPENLSQIKQSKFKIR